MQQDAPGPGFKATTNKGKTRKGSKNARNERRKSSPVQVTVKTKRLLPLPKAGRNDNRLKALSWCDFKMVYNIPQTPKSTPREQNR
jgi:hypothetical protein